jgi:hypothetical protein
MPGSENFRQLTPPPQAFFFPGGTIGSVLHNVTTDRLPYAIAASQHFVDQHGIYTIRQLINVPMAGRPLEAAMRQTLFLSYEQFQRQWVQNHKPLENERGS